MAVDTSTVQVVMPAMGDSVAEGTVLEWRKHEGDTVAVDETLVEISTDKVDAEVPAPASGTVTKLHVAEGDTVTVGALMAEIATDGGGAPAGNGTGETASEAEAPAAPEAKTIDIVTPTGGESVTEGTILQWAVKLGDEISDGDTVVEISTDKVDMELSAPASGTLTEILAEEGETVTVGQVIGRISASDGARAKDAKPAPRESAPAENGVGANATPPTDGDHVSPIARRVAAAEGVDLTSVRGSARGGRITKADVLAAGNGKGAPAELHPAHPGSELLKGGAAALARYMDQSRQIPTATSFRTLTVTVLDERRKQLKNAGQRVSFTHLIAYAIARVATEEMPVMAHHFEERDGKPHRADDRAVNLGLAVDVEKRDGSRTLMVPVIRDAGRKSFKEFLGAYNALVDNARTNSLTADDLSGGNLTLTNPGGLGTVASVPRLMVGQGTIVATGSISYPIGLEKIAPMIGAEKVMTMTSTYDHRIIQGAESGRFLQRVEALLQGTQSFY
ncbi:MAG: 2-oxo acid dehydrogenase subunit E2, partial [Actinomycetota bacterium]|nr:2-oxo acid dehydrogenase subunit E2 [Actinomycetota bacterium]